LGIALPQKARLAMTDDVVVESISALALWQRD
jgi:hypothetical protein